MKILQKRLISLGYEIGEADGIFGEKTASAVRLAQTLLADEGFGTVPTGKPDRKTTELILQEENSELLRTLLRGSRGIRVREAQQKLIGLNLLQDSADGIYGANTEAAVIAFEAEAAERIPDRIRRDGRLSVKEYEVLMSDLRAYGFEAPIYFDDNCPEKLENPYLYAKHACLINAETGEVLLEKAADEPAEPASTTKIITLLTALSMCDPDERIVIPDAAADVPADSTRVPVYPGETMTMRDLLYGMMIRSGNDAANAVAVLCAGSTEAFAEQMNRTAEELGMKHSRFANAHGYTAEGHYTTARDLVTAARYGLSQKLFREIVTCLKYTLPATEKRDILPISLKWEIFDPASEFYIPHAAGVKSGYTSSAGFCYVGAYQENGITLIAAVMGGRTRNMAWTDLKRLFAYGMAVSGTNQQSLR
ncbi:MAG: peptidoglycan-binding protein [Clostridia bacterium]|nr:peptidoglycan-binding protein [Clostridia bacterium]